MKVPNDTNNVTIVHVFGTPYEMGLAQGRLLQDEAHAFFDEVVDYYLEEVDDDFGKYLFFLPKWARKGALHFLLMRVLDLQHLATRFYTPKYFYEEMRGIAKGANLPYHLVRNMNMIPELVQMTCSMMGAWGNATKNGIDEDGNSISGGLLQMRTLDWEDKGPFQKYMTVTVYHPEAGNGHSFAMFGFPAFIAALTGYSEADVGISEKAWLKTDTDGAKKSRFGYPPSFLMRDVLQFDRSHREAEQRAMTHKRTNAIFFGVGDKETN